MSTNFSEWVEEFQISPCRIIHVGAHLVEERFEYQVKGFEPVVWVESSAQLVTESKKLLAAFLKQQVIEGTVSRISGMEVNFYVAGEEESSSSILEPKYIQASHPSVEISEIQKKTTITLDDLLKNHDLDLDSKTILVLDIQGSELDALEGCPLLLKSVTYIFSEISLRELYKNIVTFDLFVEKLKELGFRLVCAELNETTGWGEGLFMRISNSAENPPPRIQITNNGLGFGTKIRNLLVSLRIPFRFWSWIKR